jgi:protein-disulfide isomerase
VLLVALLLGGLVSSDALLAQVNITVNPAMATGPARAPVTIVEFSDYQ